MTDRFKFSRYKDEQDAKDLVKWTNVTPPDGIDEEVWMQLQRPYGYDSCKCKACEKYFTIEKVTFPLMECPHCGIEKQWEIEHKHDEYCPICFNAVVGNGGMADLEKGCMHFSSCTNKYCSTNDAIEAVGVLNRWSFYMGMPSKNALTWAQAWDKIKEAKQ